MRINSERLGALPIVNHFLGRLQLQRHLARAIVDGKPRALT